MIDLLIAGQTPQTHSKPQAAVAEAEYYRSYDAPDRRVRFRLASVAVLGLLVLAVNLLPR